MPSTVVRFTPVLPPMAASTIPTNVVATCTTATPRCHVCCGEPGDIGDHAAADTDHHVVSGEPESGEAAAQILDGARATCRLSPSPIVKTSAGTPG